ncbi:FecR family protein [Marinagarivorans algicola]|uniref:FecR family protein n=1 Tax=Marinagarivorans algicola TaxID=1513270 RepID=UPI0006B5E162|nr:FecR domain-containing protein [Marinagarivorans algicola]
MNAIDTKVAEIPDGVSDKARQWLVHLYSGHATQADYDALEAWLASDSVHRTALKRVEAVWHNIGLFDDIEALATSIEASRKRRFNPLRVISHPYHIAMAASILCVLCLFALTRYLPLDYRAVEYASLFGENKSVELDDGSVVMLSGDSRIEVILTGKQRMVQLLKGSAYFQVASDKARPFHVVGRHSSVSVLGTAFIFWQGIDTDRISVTEGEVSVSLPSENTPLGARAILSGEQITVNKDGAVGNIIKFDPNVELAWVNRRLIYDGELLHNIITDMNRYHSKNISLKNINTNIAITLSLDVNNIDQALAGLVNAYGFKIYEDDHNIKIIND